MAKALGKKYDQGEGISEDDTEACVWFSVAVANGFIEVKRQRDDMKRKLTLDQIAAAQKHAADLFGQIKANKSR